MAIFTTSPGLTRTVSLYPCSLGSRSLGGGSTVLVRSIGWPGVVCPGFGDVDAGVDRHPVDHLELDEVDVDRVRVDGQVDQIPDLPGPEGVWMRTASWKAIAAVRNHFCVPSSSLIEMIGGPPGGNAETVPNCGVTSSSSRK